MDHTGPSEQLAEVVPKTNAKRGSRAVLNTAKFNLVD